MIRIATMLAAVLLASPAIAGKRGQSPSCKEFAQMNSIDQRIIVLFANRSYYEQGCRKQVSVPAERGKLFVSLRGASSAEIAARTRPLIGTEFAPDAKDLYLKALFAELSAFASADEWRTRLHEFAGTPHARDARQAYLLALLNVLRADPRLDRLDASAADFANSDLRPQYSALRIRAAGLVLEHSTDPRSVAHACAVLAAESAGTQSGSECRSRLHMASLVARLEERKGNASLENWLEAQSEFAGSSLSATVDAEIETYLNSSGDSDTVAAACVRILNESLKGRCQKRSQDLALHLVRSAPTEENIRKAFAVCRHSPCEREVEGYQFGLRVAKELGQIASNGGGLPLSDEILRSRTLWESMERELENIASARYGTSLRQLSLVAGETIASQLRAAAAHSEQIVTIAEAKWAQTDVIVNGKLSWRPSKAWLMSIDEILQRLDKELRGALMAARLDPQNERALVLLQKIVDTRNRLVAGKRVAVSISHRLVNIGLDAVRTFAPKGVSFMVSVVQNLATGTDLGPHWSVRDYTERLRAL